MNTGTSDDDNTLLRLCIERDLSAWELFIKKYSSHMLTSIGYRLRKYGINLRQEDRKDILQNVLSLLWENGKLAEVRNPDSIKYWLAIVSGNAAIQYMRRLKREDILSPACVDAAIDETELADMIPSGDPADSEEPDRSELLKNLGRAIESLPAKERLALKLNLIYNKKYSEISEIMAMPVGTVSSHIKRAKERLRKVLRDRP